MLFFFQRFTFGFAIDPGNDFLNPMTFNHSFLLIFIIACLTGCAVNESTTRTTTRQLQKGTITEDTSYVYSLPFAPGSAHRLVQGYYSRYSHKNRAALDFKMKKGTGIFAARTGIVSRIKEDGTKGGWKRKYRPEGNFIVVQHDDGTRAGYWHLQPNGVLVNVGDTVTTGQLIGLSGRTGYALFPHLHFLVWGKNVGGKSLPIATRFKTSKGVGYLRPLKRYRSVQF